MATSVAHRPKQKHQQRWVHAHPHAHAPVATPDTNAAPASASPASSAAASSASRSAAADLPQCDSIVALRSSASHRGVHADEELVEMRTAHLALSHALAELDESITRGERPARTAGLFQSLVQDYAESPLATAHAAHYAAPGGPFPTLAAYWSNQLSAALINRWWPRLVAGISLSEDAAAAASAQHRPGEFKPRSDSGAVIACAHLLPQDAHGAVLAKAVAAVKSMPPPLLAAYARAVQLALDLHGVAAEATADALEREKALLHLSYSTLIVLLETPQNAASAPVRGTALLPDKMLAAVEALVGAVAQSATMRAESAASTAAAVDRPYTRLFSALVAAAPRNALLVAPTHAEAWKRWKAASQLLGAPLSAHAKAKAKAKATAEAKATAPAPAAPSASSSSSNGQPKPVASASAAAPVADSTVAAAAAAPAATPTRRPQIRNPAPVADGHAAVAAQPAVSASVPAPVAAVAAAVPEVPVAATLAAAAAPSELSARGNITRRGKDVASSNGLLPAAALVSRLTADLESFYSRRTLSAEDLSARAALLSGLEGVVRQVDPTLRVEAFGSSASSTAMKGSDMDVGIFSSTGKAIPPSKSFFTALLGRLRKAGSYSHIIPILGARVPILKLTERRTGIHADLAMGQLSTTHKSRLLGGYARLDGRVPRLVAAVKHWAKCNDINDGSKGTLNSFGYSLMVVQYLQLVRPAVLPSLQAQSRALAQEHARTGQADQLAPDESPDAVLMAPAMAAAAATLDDSSASSPPTPILSHADVKLLHPELAAWHSMDAAQRHFIREMGGAASSSSSSGGDVSGASPSADSPHSLGALFIGFLHFYSRVFNHETMVVNIRAGSLSARSHWGSKNSGAPHRFKNSAVLCIVDPFDPTDNVGRSIAAHTWAHIRGTMADALRRLQAGATYPQICEEEHADGQQGGARDQAARMAAQSSGFNAADLDTDDGRDTWPAPSAPQQQQQHQQRKHSPRRKKSPGGFKHGQRHMHTQAQAQTQAPPKPQPHSQQPAAQPQPSRSQPKAHFISFQQQQQHQAAAAAVRSSSASSSSSHSAAGQPPPVPRAAMPQPQPQRD